MCCLGEVQCLFLIIRKEFETASSPNSKVHKKKLNYLLIIIVFTEKRLLQASGKILQIIQDTQIIKTNTTD